MAACVRRWRLTRYKDATKQGVTPGRWLTACSYRVRIARLGETACAQLLTLPFDRHCTRPFRQNGDRPIGMAKHWPPTRRRRTPDPVDWRSELTTRAGRTGWRE